MLGPCASLALGPPWALGASQDPKALNLGSKPSEIKATDFVQASRSWHCDLRKDVLQNTLCLDVELTMVYSWSAGPYSWGRGLRLLLHLTVIETRFQIHYQLVHINGSSGPAST